MYYCEVCGQELSLTEHFSGKDLMHYAHSDLKECVKSLFENIQRLENRVDELELKESNREFSEHGPKW